MKPIAAFLALLLAAGSAEAAVVEATANGFQLKITADIQAPPSKVYEALLQPARWWNADHTFSGSAANLTLEPRAGGCFCESLPGGGSVRHLEITSVMPGRSLVLRGALGPFQAMGVEGALTLAVAPKDQGASLTLTHTIGGFVPGGLTDWAPRADAMLGEQVARLKKLLETGSP